MATYTVRLLSKSIVHKQTKPDYHEPVLIIPFTVKGLEYSDSVEIAEKDYSKGKVKKLVKDKIIAFLAKQAGEEEYQVTI